MSNDRPEMLIPASKFPKVDLTAAGQVVGRAMRGMHLRPWTTWRHVATDSLYTIIGVATCSTNGDREGTERSVVYLSHEKQILHYREISEFLDGRFEKAGQ